MCALLRVVLDDQLFLQRDVDLRALGGELVDQHPETLADDLQPTRDRAIALGLAGNLERQRAQRLLADIDDVVLGDAVAGGMSTFLPLTRKWPWLTSWRACRRVRARPAR